MLATAAAAVQLHNLRTPEPAVGSMAIDQALSTCWNLVERLPVAAADQQPIHHVAEVIVRQRLVLGRDLLRAFLDWAGDGDGGPTLTIAGATPAEPPQVLRRWATPRCRPHLSLVGEVAIERVGSGHDRRDAAPLDARRHRPRRPYSSWLQPWWAVFVIDDAQAQAVRTLGTILGISMPVRTAEDLNREPASAVEPFQDTRPVPEPSQEGAIVVLSADSQGVPLVRSALAAVGDEPRQPPASSPPHPRRGKGEKANRKRMAAVGAVDTIEPWVRATAEVIDELQQPKARQRRPHPQHQRVRADLWLGQVSLFLGLADELCRRNPAGTKPVVVLSDGERPLHDRQGECLPAGVTGILDLRHVMERLGKVAWCLFEAAKQKAPAERWVEDRLGMPREGKVGHVIGGLRQTLTKRQLRGSRRQTVREVIGYFDGTRSRLRYDEYLAAGDPIGRGVIEGACRQLVQDRLERAGMRWQADGAQAMLDLRATDLNGEWNGFGTAQVEREDDRLSGKLRHIG